MVRRSVILRHELPGGAWHYDWMIERDIPEERRLLTYRTGVRPDDGSPGAFAAERIGEHRAKYLDFEGELDGGRGVVRRVAEGRILQIDDHSEMFVEIAWDEQVILYQFRNATADQVLVTRTGK